MSRPKASSTLTQRRPSLQALCASITDNVNKLSQSQDEQVYGVLLETIVELDKAKLIEW